MEPLVKDIHTATGLPEEACRNAAKVMLNNPKVRKALLREAMVQYARFFGVTK